MRTLPPEPKPGDRISANLIRELIRAVRERTPTNGPGYRVSIGPNGFSLDIKKNPKKAEMSVYNDVGRFVITDLGDPSEYPRTITFGNRYYRVGGKTYEVSSETASVTSSSIVAVRVDMTEGQPTASFETYMGLHSLQFAEADTNYYILPLYQFDENFNVTCDFRTGPDAAAGEF